MSRAGLVVQLAFSVEATFIPLFHEKSQLRAAHAQCVTRCPVSRLFHSPGRPVSVVTWKISILDPGITILGSRINGLARLSSNGKIDFCCV